MNENDLIDTRRSLHAVAELIMAGPQYRGSGTIRLRVTPGGFATVAAPVLRVEGGELLTGDERVPLNGTSLRALGTAAGVTPGAPENLYSDGSGASLDDVLRVDADAAARLAESLAHGDAALRELVPGEIPVLWPEHFDLGISVDKVNYGVSLGDGYIPVPYAYVGPWEPRSGPFWNAPFGAARPLGEVPDLLAFFAEGRERAAAPESTMGA
ncbi:hypothetical protein [Sphaerisporangium fuscum]|uniref:hypothetical protein n=1 Tax=Sphaerisporangium fuscum TaxID=2835868 RepID=UPI001BDC6797|nr:hypothetical protein [Sphaerisporangium fuscum]